MLKKIGLLKEWENWVGFLFSFTLFYILVNDSPSSPFNSSGIFQGDPPLLFILIDKVLGQSLKFVVSSNSIKSDCL